MSCHHRGGFGSPDARANPLMMLFVLVFGLPIMIWRGRKGWWV